MKLYFETPQDTLRAIQQHGFAAALGHATALCCDRSQAHVQPLPEVTEAFAELTLEVPAGVSLSPYETFPMDLPSARWFEIPAKVTDKWVIEA